MCPTCPSNEPCPAPVTCPSKYTRPCPPVETIIHCDRPPKSCPTPHNTTTTVTVYDTTTETSTSFITVSDCTTFLPTTTVTDTAPGETITVSVPVFIPGDNSTVYITLPPETITINSTITVTLPAQVITITEPGPPPTTVTETLPEPPPVTITETIQPGNTPVTVTETETELTTQFTTSTTTVTTTSTTTDFEPTTVISTLTINDDEPPTTVTVTDINDVTVTITVDDDTLSTITVTEDTTATATATITVTDDGETVTVTEIDDVTVTITVDDDTLSTITVTEETTATATITLTHDGETVTVTDSSTETITVTDEGETPPALTETAVITVLSPTTLIITVTDTDVDPPTTMTITDVQTATALVTVTGEAPAAESVTVLATVTEEAPVVAPVTAIVTMTEAAPPAVAPPAPPPDTVTAVVTVGGTPVTVTAPAPPPTRTASLPSPSTSFLPALSISNGVATLNYGRLRDGGRTLSPALQRKREEAVDQLFNGYCRGFRARGKTDLDELTFEGDEVSKDANRRAANCTIEQCTDAGPDKSCNQYPFAITQEGGAEAVSACVDNMAQSIQGVYLSIMRKQMGLRSGNKFSFALAGFNCSTVPDSSGLTPRSLPNSDALNTYTVRSFAKRDLGVGETETQEQAFSAFNEFETNVVINPIGDLSAGSYQVVGHVEEGSYNEARVVDNEGQTYNSSDIQTYSDQNTTLTFNLPFDGLGMSFLLDTRLTDMRFRSSLLLASGAQKTLVQRSAGVFVVFAVLVPGLLMFL